MMSQYELVSSKKGQAPAAKEPTNEVMIMDTNLIDRIHSIGYDLEKLIYQISWLDILTVLEDNLDEMGLSASLLTDDELTDLMNAIAVDVENTIDWYDVVQTAFMAHWPERLT